MKQAGHSKRSYGRSPERHRQAHKQTNGSSGDTKFRGNPQQSVEKYLTLARDAASSGDPVSAENYYQYADHYYRIALANRMSRTHRPERSAQEDGSQANTSPPVSSEEKPPEAPPPSQ